MAAILEGDLAGASADLKEIEDAVAAIPSAEWDHPVVRSLRELVASDKEVIGLMPISFVRGEMISELGTVGEARWARAQYHSGAVHV